MRDGEPVIVAGALNASVAERCSQAISKGLESGALTRSADLPFLVTVAKPLDLFGDEIMAVFDGRLGEKLREFYGCEFRVQWLDCYRTYHGEPQASWLWHIDNVPPYLLKVLLYLTDSDADTGVTEFMSGVDTRRFKAVGYFGVTREERRADLEEVARQRHIAYRPLCYPVKCGDAIIFNTNNLHRGGVVRRGFRDVMSFMIFPSRRTWRSHFEEMGPARVQIAGGYFRKTPL
jgi:hypothetical protein